MCMHACIQVTAAADGTYSASYTATAAGLYELVVLLGDRHIGGSPFSVAVAAAETSGRCSALSGIDRAESVAGEAVSVRLEARDRFGNRREVGGDAVTASLRGTGSEVGVRVTDSGDGTYELAWLCEKAGEYELDVSIGGEAVLGSPHCIRVAAADVDASRVEVDFPSGEVVAGAVCTATARTFDRFGNAAAVEAVSSIGPSVSSVGSQ